jgi:hypothetical protein
MGQTASKCISKCIKPCSILVGKIPSCCYNKISDTDKYNLSLLIDDFDKPGDFILSHIDNRMLLILFLKLSIYGGELKTFTSHDLDLATAVENAVP